MLMKRPKHRVFDYTPRFYKPEHDEINKKRKKINFNNVRKVQRKRRSPVIWLILVVLLFYLYLKLSGSV